LSELPFGSGASRWNEPSAAGFSVVLIPRPLLLPIAVIVTVFTDMLELKPPPFGCDGGASSTVPSMFTAAPHGFTTPSNPVEVRARRSATPDGAGNVVMSMMRALSRVIGAPVLFVNLRLTLIVPNVELLAGSLVKSRTRFGGNEAATQGNTKLAETPLSRRIGLVRLSGPGAPSR